MFKYINFNGNMKIILIILLLILILIVILIVIRCLHNFKELCNESFNESTIDGDEIYIKLPHGAESSRYNYKTKECKHWYNLQFIERILEKKYNNVLMLGVALGGIAVHLLDKNPNINITGVDISDKHFDIVKKYSDNTRLNLIKADANIYVLSSQQKFNVIICDIFLNSTVPDFVLTKTFMDAIYNMLLPKGLFLINLIRVDETKIMNLIKDSFPDSTIESKKHNGNFLIFVSLNN